MKELGLQLYSIRDYLNTYDEAYEALKAIKEMGYTVVQTAGMKISAEELAEITQKLGITICGTHCNLETLLEDPEKAMEMHRILGTTNIGIGGFFGPDAAAAKALIESINAFADIIYAHGFKFTYHNHDHEFMKVEGGKTMMDMLVEGLDPVKTSFCLDTHWVQRGGGDVCSWIEKLAGRIDILHLKDMTVRPGRVPYYCEIGEGNMDFDKIIATAEKVGVKYYVVEQDDCPGDPLDSVRKSAEYIKRKYM